MKYPLIEKWLGLEFTELFTTKGLVKYVKAEELEAKLSEGFEIYSDDSIYFDSIESREIDNYVALAIGKQPIKKKTREEAALEFVASIFFNITMPPELHDKAKEILEMK